MTADRKRLQTVTLGCSKNKVDTEHLLSQVEDLYEIIPEGEDIPVDIILLNTCGFIGDAKEESVEAVLEAVERKRRGEADKVVVFGCLSQRYANELPELIPEVDAWFGAREFDPVISYLGAEPDRRRDTERYLTTASHYAYLKISEGCDRRCSYCAIPFIRGGHKSIPMETLVQEAERLAEKEFVNLLSLLRILHIMVLTFTDAVLLQIFCRSCLK
jgi:ribosomal protein S12 methylthiotransferase